MNTFWTTWIVILTLGNVAFALWLLRATTYRKPGDSSAGPQTTGHSWDGDLAEYNNPLPRWWLGLFYLSIVFALAYLVLYPGLGAYRGSNQWSSAAQWKGEVEQADRASAPIYARYQDMGVADLEHDPGAMSTARHLFAVNCAQCHGADGHGATGFPNLSAPNWQWGRDPDAVIETITNGRQAQMPPWGDVLGQGGVASVAEYVYSLSGRAGSPAAVDPGKQAFETYCAACHGADGHGLQAVGAPDLTDAYWLYGGSLATITQTVTAGRQGQMPAHGARLSTAQIRVLAAYVLSLADAGSGPGR